MTVAQLMRTISQREYMEWSYFYETEAEELRRLRRER